MSSRSKNSIKNEYAPMFKTLYWVTIGVFSAVVAFVLIDGILTANNAYERQERLSREYKEAMTQHILPVPKKADDSEQMDEDSEKGSSDDAAEESEDESSSEEDKPTPL